MFGQIKHMYLTICQIPYFGTKSLMSLYILIKAQDLSVSRPIQSYNVCDLKKKSYFQQFITHTPPLLPSPPKAKTTKTQIKAGEKEWGSKNLLFIWPCQVKETHETQISYWSRNYSL